MRIGRIFIGGFFLLFGMIGAAALFKNKNNNNESPQIREEIEAISLVCQQKLPVVEATPLAVSESALVETEKELDRIPLLFTLDSSKLPIVETISYTSRVPWLKGRPAWISDYANHYSTSKHFIARSLNKKTDYLTQKISPGDRFNVFKLGLNLQFHLVLDLSKCRLWFYYLNLDTNERVLLKSYRVGVGRIDSRSSSKSLTPVGSYRLGERVAIYKPGMQGFFQNRKTEMIRVFGTRWIPFEKGEGAHGLGIHGAPWIEDSATGGLVEDSSTIGKYNSDGCIRLLSKDIEELFAIIITKNTTLEIVNEFREAKLPGVEKNL